MARVVVLGGGIAGHTAALHLTRMLKGSDEVVVVTPNSKWNWIPSNIWVGVGEIKTDQVTFNLGPIYQRKGIEFHQALATAIHPQGDGSHAKPFVDLTYTDTARAGEHGQLEYDYLVNATGPKLNFGATPGLGPNGHSFSVCTSSHAADASAALQGSIARMKKGESQVLVVGMGHGTCTCEDAAFEYAFNVEHEVRQAGVRALADIVYVTNEYELGDLVSGASRACP
jgi:sulfide:quinone oxidoreductase